jgi:hypothetical protein
MSDAKEEKKVTISICLGEVVHSDFKTDKKTFKIPNIQEISRSPSIEVTEKELQELAKWFYDNAIYTHPKGYYAITLEDRGG